MSWNLFVVEGIKKHNPTVFSKDRTHHYSIELWTFGECSPTNTHTIQSIEFLFEVKLPNKHESCCYGTTANYMHMYSIREAFMLPRSDICMLEKWQNVFKQAKWQTNKKSKSKEKPYSFLWLKSKEKKWWWTLAYLLDAK